MMTRIGFAAMMFLPAFAVACGVPTASDDQTSEQSQQAGDEPETSGVDAGAGGASTGAATPRQGETAPDAGAAVAPPPAEKPDVPPGATWLAQFNIYRKAAQLSPIVEDKNLSAAAALHARYMVRADKVTHDEDSKSPHYTKAGDESGKNSDILASDRVGRFDTSIDNFAKAPFHALLFLNPKLEKSGYGEFTEAGPAFTYAAVLNVRQGVDDHRVVPESTYPIRFPEDGTVVPIREAVTEYPDPIASCAGYGYPAGLPIVVQLSPKKDASKLGAHTIKVGGKALDHCVFTAKTYTNAKDPIGQALGRVLLDDANAVVIIPKAPLAPKAQVEVSLTADGDAMKWSFKVANNAH